MTLRYTILVLAVLFGISIWAWSRNDHSIAHPANGSTAPSAHDKGTTPGGTHSEAAYRFRMNQSHHWRQVALGR